MTELTTIDLLVIDDFALEPMSRDESRDIYQLFVERNGRAATILTSNHRRRGSGLECRTLDWPDCWHGAALPAERYGGGASRL
jgi:hypothetical protein